MSIFKRLSDLVRSNVNDALDKAEDPRKVLEQTILDMEAEHKKARQKLLESMTLTKQTEKQAVGYRQQATDWEAKAMAALKAGNEDLARKALAEKQTVEAMALEAETGVQAQAASTEDLKGQIKNLEEKVGEAKRKKEELLARLNAAELQKKNAAIQSGTSSATNAVNDASAFDTFNRMVGKIENSEAEADARKELMGTTSAGSEVDAELKKLTATQTADDALAALKAKMTTSTTSGTPAPTAPAAATPAPAAAIDDELAALKAKLGAG